MVNSRAKGARGELEWAKYLGELGFPARRGQQFQGTPDSPDVVGGIPGTHAEVKRVEKLCIDKAMKQAEEDCGEDIPYVAHRRNHGPWLVTMRALDILAFGDIVQGRNPGPEEDAMEYSACYNVVRRAEQRGLPRRPGKQGNI